MKDETWQKRQFILSSFSRLKITFNTNVYHFADKLIKEKWDSSTLDLSEVDYFIKQEFDKFNRGA